MPSSSLGKVPLVPVLWSGYLHALYKTSKILVNQWLFTGNNGKIPGKMYWTPVEHSQNGSCIPALGPSLQHEKKPLIVHLIVSRASYCVWRLYVMSSGCVPCIQWGLASWQILNDLAIIFPDFSNNRKNISNIKCFANPHWRLIPQDDLSPAY